MTKQFRDDVIVRLIELNKDKSESSKCPDIRSCKGISCLECPFNARNGHHTVGQVRAMDPRNIEPAPEPTAEKIEGVTKPSHYQLFPNVEAIEIIARSMTGEQFEGYCLGNILKYRLRAGKKSELASIEKDLAKADFYVELFEKHKGLCHG